MHLRSITLKGFKSFPDRTKLEFAPGVSVIVGPNGSGKSNVTDAVLWAMGEQSPLAVRGQSMQDVIFGGGRGVQARSSAEVEIVLDNADGGIDLPMGEISILRRLDRSGEGEYRLNGAKCRLVDVLEILSDTGLGKEMHSVVSQGRVEAIVTSKPRDRRLLIEEAAGLGKHRKRRRRAQLKLERTQQNLDRALDVEREARSRLRPLKRQAEAAELHERLERQTDEARWELARDAVRASTLERSAAEAAAVAAKQARDETQAELAAIATRRQAAEEALAQRTEERERLVRGVSVARGAQDRIELRTERVTEAAELTAERIERREAQLAALRAEAELDAPDEVGNERIAALEAELAQLAEEHEAALVRELEALEHGRVSAAARVAELDTLLAERQSALADADRAAEVARQARRAAETSSEAARREAARVGAELAAANQFLRSHAAPPDGARSLAGDLEVQPGFETALAAVLAGRLSAAVVADLDAGVALLDRAGADGGSALVSGAEGADTTSSAAPVADAVRLADVVGGPDEAVALARSLLADAWVVDDLAAVPSTFAGIAVTRAGRAWLPSARELRQSPQGGSERVLVKRNERDALIAASEQVVQAEQAALGAVEEARRVVTAADTSREEADRAVRETDRERAAAAEAERRAAWLIEQRRAAPEEGAAAVRRAQVDGELAAERRVAERAAKQREERTARIARLERSLGADRALLPQAERLAAALAGALEGVRAHVAAVEALLHADREAGEGVAAELRACASAEAEIQNRLRQRGEAVTGAEVRLAQARDHDVEVRRELDALAARLGLPAQPSDDPLDPEQAAGLRTRIERLLRRREQLGPVNPLAKAEYDEAVAHVEELEHQRTDLETALRELRTFIRDTDRQIQETFEETFTAAAKNFEELSQHVFPGGRGRLRLVREDTAPKRVLGGASEDDEAQTDEEQSEEAAEAEAQQLEDGDPADEELGVEIEITPAGKSMKRLTLLSGGEKSMTAIAFLFSVFLAKPCPFYILDEVEAALDDLNISRFLALLQRYRDHAQFIVVTHQKRTMEAADTLYGVSMGDDGVSKVVSRRLPRDELDAADAARAVV
jgi:chromosome segregation protein